jgi:hypothetical protein
MLTPKPFAAGGFNGAWRGLDHNLLLSTRLVAPIVVLYVKDYSDKRH